MNLAQYADHAGVSVRTVERWLSAGELPGATQAPDGRWHIPADTIRTRPLERQPRQTDVSPSRRGDVVVSAPVPQALTLAEHLSMLPALLTVEQAAQVLGISESQVRLHARELDGLRWGRSWMIPQAAVKKLAALCQCQCQAP
jgi:excisionase family DNA binding protein